MIKNKELYKYLTNELHINDCYAELIILSSERVKNAEDKGRENVYRGRLIKLYVRAMQRSNHARY